MVACSTNSSLKSEILSKSMVGEKLVGVKFKTNDYTPHKPMINEK